jgi:hypothetical protein
MKIGTKVVLKIERNFVRLNGSLIVCYVVVVWTEREGEREREMKVLQWSDSLVLQIEQARRDTACHTAGSGSDCCRCIVSVL